jgi:2-C-methyl-D-erythritol 4-phosphate cytidylyltransferase
VEKLIYKNMNIAIVLASGKGKRMGAGKNKVLLEISKKPIIYYTLLVFEKSPEINEIMVVCPKTEINIFKKLVAKYKFRKVKHVFEGGQERQESAYNALKYLQNILSDGKKKKTLVLFHDGANPFITENEISESLIAARKYGASVVAHSTKDTIKEVDSNKFVVKTLTRSRLWNMQTPQTIKFNLAWQAFSEAKKEKYSGTDDVSLVEKLGGRVKIIEGSMYNYKITTPLDFEIAKIILKKLHIK